MSAVGICGCNFMSFSSYYSSHNLGLFNEGYDTFDCEFYGKYEFKYLPDSMYVAQALGAFSFVMGLFLAVACLFMFCIKFSRW